MEERVVIISLHALWASRRSGLTNPWSEAEASSLKDQMEVGGDAAKLFHRVRWKIVFMPLLEWTELERWVDRDDEEQCSINCPFDEGACQFDEGSDATFPEVKDGSNEGACQWDEGCDATFVEGAC